MKEKFSVETYDPLVNKSFKMRRSMVRQIKNKSRETGLRELHMAQEAFAQYFATNFQATK